MESLVICVGLALWIAIPFCLYPMALAFRIRPSPSHADLEVRSLPSVSVIVPAHNERDVIAQRIQNLLAQDYPAEKLTILVVSDGSTDGTDDVVVHLAGPRVRLLRTGTHVGKTVAAEHGAAAAEGEVLLFTDASTRWESDCTRQLAVALSEPMAGCVSGRVIYEDSQKGVARGFRLWQRLVVWLRRNEGEHGGLVSVSGCVHGVRREMWRELPADIDPDLALPAIAAAHRRKSNYVSSAVAWEKPRCSVQAEFRARRRIATRAIHTGIWAMGLAARTKAWRYLLRLMAHKVLRWTCWVPAVGLVLVPALSLSAQPVMLPIICTQVALYSLAAVGLVASTRHANLRFLAGPAYWALGITALGLATVDVVRGERARIWSKYEE